MPPPLRGPTRHNPRVGPPEGASLSLRYLRCFRRDLISGNVLTMTMTEQADVRGEIDAVIARAAVHEIALTWSDFRVIDGCPLIDGTPAGEWLDAMTMD